MQPINIMGAVTTMLFVTLYKIFRSSFRPRTSPQLSTVRAWPMEHEIAHVEWIYEYFAQISFSNGTTKEISAGFTAFQPLYDPAHASQGLTSATVRLKPISFGGMGEPTANYSIELSTDSGFTFAAGMIQAIYVVLTPLIARH
ncbi:hypothetical protein J3R82DRAFT_6526 [Butyriboletus roseoflavus]|nr:hypothetical protein J3R82DRAFT_6526 [Butyriboletus roseoflavus]